MSSTAMTGLNALIVLAVLGLMISRQMRARPFTWRALVLVPALMGYAGVRAPRASGGDVTRVAGPGRAGVLAGDDGRVPALAGGGPGPAGPHRARTGDGPAQRRTAQRLGVLGGAAGTPPHDPARGGHAGDRAVRLGTGAAGPQ